MRDGDYILERRVGALIALTLVSAIMLAAACGGGDSVPATARDADEPTDPPAIVMLDAGVHSDSEIMQVLLTQNTGEIERAKLAQSKATNDDVKEFAGLMLTEHGAINERLQAIGRDKAIGADNSSVNETAKNDDAKFAERLGTTEGAAFDRAYIEAEIVAHVKAMSVIDHALKPTVVDQDLSQMLSELMVSGTNHREHAQQIMSALRADASATRPDAGTTTRDAGGQREGGAGTQ
jgi:putative membrane protein